MRNSSNSCSGLVQQFIGTAYDTVKVVADNLEEVIAAGEAWGSLDTYMGSHVIPPTERNNGTPLQNGDLYTSELNGSMYYWDGVNEQWVAFSGKELSLLKDEAVQAAVEAEAHKESAGVSETNAANSAATANTKALEANNSAISANTSKLAAEQAKSDAEGFANEASTSASEASSSATEAEQAKTEAGNSSDSAEGSKTAAESFAANANTSAIGAATSATTAEKIAQDLNKPIEALGNGVYELPNKTFTAYNQYLTQDGVKYKPLTVPYTTAISVYPLATDDPNIAPYTVEGGSVIRDPVELSPYDIGYTEETYLATPRQAINDTLAALVPLGGGTVRLPTIDVTVVLDAEMASYGYKKILIPAIAGLSFKIKGDTHRSQWYIDKSNVSDTTDTAWWRLCEVGDQVTGESGWSYADTDGSGDNGARTYDLTKMPTQVVIEDWWCTGDEPSPDFNATSVGAYEYHDGFLGIFGCYEALIINCRAEGFLNTAITAGFNVRSYLYKCHAINVGWRKFTGAPANGFDILGLGADTPENLTSFALIKDCHTEDVHDVGYMSVWSDTFVDSCTSHGCSISVENQEASFATLREDMGGSVHVLGCVFDGYNGHIPNAEAGRLADQIVMNGGVNKHHSIQDTIIKNAQNMAIAGYSADSRNSLSLVNVTLEDCGHSPYHEFPTVLFRGSTLKVHGGNWIRNKHSGLQLLEDTQAIWSAPTHTEDCARSLVTGGKYIEADFVIKGQGNIGYNGGFGTNQLKLRLNLAESTSSDIIRVVNWDNTKGSILGEVEVDWGYNTSDQRLLYVPNPDSVVNLKITEKNRLVKLANPTGSEGLQTNSNWGYIASALVKINGDYTFFKEGALVDFKTGKTEGGTLTTLIDNSSEAEATLEGYCMSELNTVGSIPVLDTPYTPPSSADFLQVSNTFKAELAPTGSDSIALLLNVASPTFLNIFAGNELGGTRTLFQWVNGGNTVTCTRWSAQGREEVYLSFNLNGIDTPLYIQLPHAESAQIGVYLNYTTNDATLIVNGRIQTINVVGLSQYCDFSQGELLLGVSSEATNPNPDFYDPRVYNGYFERLQGFEISPSILPAEVLAKFME